MNNRVTLCENALDPATWTTHECGDLRPFLVEHFGEWPKTARIYLNRVGKDTDVTPYDEGGIERLGSLNGHFFVVVYPAELAIIVLIVSIALSAASLVIGYLLRPSLPKNQESGSPTNSLSARQNKERINERIPDIYGTLWVTPDLIGVPYRIFIGNREVEFMFMCIGRGEYDIAQVRDDVTPIEQIDGAGCEIYGPNTSPNSGDAAQVSIGEPINEPIKNVKQYSSVNGQTLRAPNAGSFKANNNVRFTDDGTLEGSGDIDFTDFFDSGTGTNPKYLVIRNSDYDGTYLILDVTTTQIVLSNPGAVNAAWGDIVGATDYGSPTLLNSSDNFEGPFLIVDNTVNELWCNFVASQGLYEIDSDGNQHAMAVTIQIEVTSIDNNYTAQGSPIYFQTTLKGSGVMRTMCGATLVVHLPIAGSCKVRARRLTNTDLRDGWNVVDQIQWRDLYGVAPLEQTDFGNVTTIQTITWPTPQALSIKQRKINVLVGRKINRTGSIATYLLNETSGAIAYNSTGGVNGSIVGSITQGAVGIENTAYEFTGLGYITAALAVQRSFTVDFYFKTTAVPTVNTGAPMSSGMGLVSSEHSGYWLDWSINLGLGGTVVFSVGAKTPSNDLDLISPLSYNDGLFHHITATRNQTTGLCKLYVDGILVASGTPVDHATDDLTDAASIVIGAIRETVGAFPDVRFVGVLDKIIIDGTPDFSSESVSQNAADILISMALDPYTGRRAESEIDRAGIQSALGSGGEVETYFGTSLCTQFCYAFDDSKMSFEEMVAVVCQAVFCTAYRRGSILSVVFEKETADSTILFNHRNKLPGSETRTVKFGTASENDGIDLDYIEPNAPNAQNVDSVYTLHFPEDGSAVAAKKVTAVGVRNRVQAWMLGWRLYNKLLYQNTVTQFDATAEAGLCVINERILVADNTRPDIQDGEVLAQDGLEITLSQPVTF
jgi:hypothetical protein